MAIEKRCDATKMQLVGPDACETDLVCRDPDGWELRITVTRTPDGLEHPCLSRRAVERMIAEHGLRAEEAQDDAVRRLPVERRG